jgi:hypothetical protein
MTQSRVVAYLTVDESGRSQELIETETSITEILHVECKETGEFAHRELQTFEQNETFNKDIVMENMGFEEYVHLKSMSDEIEYVNGNGAMPQRGGGPPESPPKPQEEHEGQNNEGNGVDPDHHAGQSEAECSPRSEGRAQTHPPHQYPKAKFFFAASPFSPTGNFSPRSGNPSPRSPEEFGISGDKSRSHQRRGWAGNANSTGESRIPDPQYKFSECSHRPVEDDGNNVLDSTYGSDILAGTGISENSTHRYPKEGYLSDDISGNIKEDYEIEEDEGVSVLALKSPSHFVLDSMLDYDNGTEEEEVPHDELRRNESKWLMADEID